MKRILILWSLLLVSSLGLSQQPPWRRARGTEDFWTGAMDIYRKSPATLCAIGEHHAGTPFRFMLSTDYGESWDSVGYMGTDFGTLKIDPTNSQVMYISIYGMDPDGNDIYMTTDGGQTWVRLSFGRFSPDLLIEIDPRNPRIVYRGWQSSLFQTTDRGQIWRDILDWGPMSSMAIFPANDSILYIDCGGSILKSTNLGSTWSSQCGNGCWGIIRVDPRDANTLYLAQYGNGVSKSTDGGNSWTQMNNGLGWRDLDIYVFEINQKHPDELLFGTGSDTVGNKILFRSTDGGAHWNEFSNGLPDSCHVSSIVIDTMYDRVYIGVNTCCDDSLGVYIFGPSLISTSYLSRWNLVSVPESLRDYRTNVVFPTSVGKAYAYRNGYAAGDTLSGGVGYWLKFDAPQTVTFPPGQAVESESISVVSGWNLIGAIGSPVPVASVSSNPSGMATSEFFGYSSGYHSADTIQPGKGYWVKVTQSGKLILSSSSTLQSSQMANKLSANHIRIVLTNEEPPLPPDGEMGNPIHQTRSLYALTQNYPNPFNPQTQIEFSTVNEDYIILEVFDIIGKKVATLVDGKVKPGIHSVNFDGSQLSSGFYYYRLRTSQGTITRKMMILR